MSRLVHLMIVIAVAIPGCRGTHPPSSAETPPPLLESPHITIVPDHGEVWSHELTFSGELHTRMTACCLSTPNRSSCEPVAVEEVPYRWASRAAIPIVAGPNHITLICRDASGREHHASAHVDGMLRDSSLHQHADVRSKSERAVGREVRDGIVYGVVPRLFGQPPSCLRAVKDRLGDLQGLGVDVLWLTPIFATSPPSDFGYAVIDYLTVRSDYGTFDDLTALVDEAHRHDMRVVLDLVPNHTSIAHRYFQDALTFGKRSHYWSFYARDDRGEPTHYFDWVNLPNLEYRNPEVRTWMLEIGKRWIEHARVDGYRLDAAWAVAERAPDFWDDFRNQVRALDPRAILLAEASARDPFWSAHGFDAAYDWTNAPGEWAWKDVFSPSSATTIADRLDAAVRASSSSPDRTLRFLENNDTGPRFITKHSPELTKVAAVALLTLPGIPALFTGQERGAEYEPYAAISDGASPTLSPNDDPHQLRALYQSLIMLRHDLPALRSPVYRRLDVAPVEKNARAPADILAYERGGDDDEGDSHAIVVLRFDNHDDPSRERRVRVKLRRKRAWREALPPSTTALRSSEDGMLTLSLPPYGYRILVTRP